MSNIFLSLTFGGDTPARLSPIGVVSMDRVVGTDEVLVVTDGIHGLQTPFDRVFISGAVEPEFNTGGEAMHRMYGEEVIVTGPDTFSMRLRGDTASASGTIVCLRDIWHKKKLEVSVEGTKPLDDLDGKLLFLPEVDVLPTYATGYSDGQAAGLAAGALVDVTYQSRGPAENVVTTKIGSTVVSDVTLTGPGLAFYIHDEPDLAVIDFPNLTSTSANGIVFNSNPNLAYVGLDVFASGALEITGSPKLRGLYLPALTAITSSLRLNANQLCAVNLPLLTSVTLDFIYYNQLSPTLLKIYAPLLATIGGNLAGAGNPALTEVYYPSLVSVSGPDGINYQDCTALVEVHFPSLVPVNGKPIVFNNCALNEESVDGILARCVANAAYVSGTVNLAGGTSAPPSVTGAADKATLIGRGVTVTTN